MTTFLEVFKQIPTPAQAEALDWLNRNAGYHRVGFTKLWRNQWLYAPGSPDLVDFRRVAAYFTAASHQIRAIEYLQKNCPPNIRDEFFRRWLAAHPTTQTDKKLTERDYQQAAIMLGVDTAHIKAIVEVECRGSGFDDQGRPVILFEAAYFSYYTGGRYDRSHPHLSSRNWNPNLYTTDEWGRLQQAIRLDKTAAYMSCSWGLGQVMGEHYKLLGYPTIDQFVAAMHESEAKQLDAMLKYIQANNLVDALKRRDWEAFALGYNGEGYAKNNYHIKLAEAYRKYHQTSEK